MTRLEPDAPTRNLLDFIAGSPTPFHAVGEAACRLEGAGFTRLLEEDAWRLSSGDRHYVTRNDSSILAFRVGTAPLGEAGCDVVGAHTDSPNLRVKPQPDIDACGYRQVGVEVYGGVLLNSWLDRDLGIAGRLSIEDGNGPATRLIKIDRPVARVPQLAIHLDRDVNTKGLKLDRQRHLPPVLGLESGPAFLDWLAAEAGVERDAVTAFDLMFHVLEPPAFAGVSGEFINAPRLDNLAMCHAGVVALIAATEAAESERTRVVALYDNEEIGSATAQGAAGSFLEDLLARLAVGAGDPEAIYRAKARSLMLSADMAHAVHPNFADRHDGQHMPKIGEGPVIKINANARYATDAESSAAFEHLCRDVGVPVQKFVMRTDLACGSTIGPIVATRLGMKTVDIGNPMLSMHSCREMAGTADHALMIRAMTRFFSDRS